MPRNQNEDPVSGDVNFDRIVYRALKECGWLLPETPEEVRRAEAALLAEEIELPDELLDPFRVLDAQAERKPNTAANAPAARPSDQGPSLPSGLTELAREVGLSHQQTLNLFSMQSQVIAHRSSSKKDELSREDWRRFYEAVKEFL